DSDGLSNWQEYLAGTDPTNAASTLRLLSPASTPSGNSLSWLSVTNRSYFVQRATILAPADFTTIQSNIPGQPSAITYADTNPPPSAAFYRVGVQ
ncbi:MAG TPA: thrombospondin type 3 repeat-containing protein, partial [Candidatus Dormibacteraeota bacterium]|nr:thrombospondin type 3 repeat-containing protein [Candidatus Dormibacteraeota bacterium]